MKGIKAAIVAGCAAMVVASGVGRAEDQESYCQTLSSLVDAARSGFASAQQVSLDGASKCGLDQQTRSFGCIWSFNTPSAANSNYQKMLKLVQSCFPQVRPVSSRSSRGTLHTEYDFGRGQPLIDISRSVDQKKQGVEWYSIDVVAP